MCTYNITLSSCQCPNAGSNITITSGTSSCSITGSSYTVNVTGTSQQNITTPANSNAGISAMDIISDAPAHKSYTRRAPLPIPHEAVKQLPDELTSELQKLVALDTASFVMIVCDDGVRAPEFNAFTIGLDEIFFPSSPTWHQITAMPEYHNLLMPWLVRPTQTVLWALSGGQGWDLVWSHEYGEQAQRTKLLFRKQEHA
ncbi:hypothetical protein BDZ91DRAFT_733601 [Kalaharituber pfeilii]|nr:hypothetical protein BDZ91DRAFT_733601 [Kalaharituber pfeilii]